LVVGVGGSEVEGMGRCHGGGRLVETKNNEERKQHPLNYYNRGAREQLKRVTLI